MIICYLRPPLEGAHEFCAYSTARKTTFVGGVVCRVSDEVYACIATPLCDSCIPTNHDEYSNLEKK